MQVVQEHASHVMGHLDMDLKEQEMDKAVSKIAVLMNRSKSSKTQVQVRCTPHPETCHGSLPCMKRRISKLCVTRLLAFNVSRVEDFEEKRYARLSCGKRRCAKHVIVLGTIRCGCICLLSLLPCPATRLQTMLDATGNEMDAQTKAWLIETYTNDPTSERNVFSARKSASELSLKALSFKEATPAKKLSYLEEVSAVRID